MIIPTLSAGEKLARCLESLDKQSFSEFDVIIIDNSGRGAASEFAREPEVRVIENERNVGFGRAVNQGIAASEAEFICTLNDDAYPAAEWLQSLIETCESNERVGMCASQIRLRADPSRLDSAGLDIYADGTTKQRCHGGRAEAGGEPREVLVPSACAALYRRSMLDRIGLFDEAYFLYCEDADLGLRGRLAGWDCLYAPSAVVEHDYSSSAGRASSLKAYFVERNRLFTVVKVFPSLLLPLAPWFSAWRYAAHGRAILRGRGLASEFTKSGEKWWRLVIIVMSAHWGALLRTPELLRKRKVVQRAAVLDSFAFWRLLRRHYTKAAEIALQ